MNRFIVSICFFSSLLNAQEPCGTEKLYKTVEQKAQKEQALQTLYQQPIQKDGSARLIPVVFHVIHDCGEENISDEQIYDQMRHINLALRGNDPLGTNLPSHFNALKTDAQIEFRLARKDPSGNCTNGIIHVQSNLTNHYIDNDRDLKSLSHWPSDNYLNIYVVQSIDEGTIAGYAFFPNTTTELQDGIVIVHDAVGSIGSAFGQGSRNQNTLTHEFGHYMGLRHIWGDQECGSDGVGDTPQHFNANLGLCPTYPFITSCNGGNNAPHGEMFMNYMDYSNSNCQNMFSNGQGTVFNQTLSWSRSNLVSTTNNLNTGISYTNTSFTTTCKPKSFFCSGETVCAGAPLRLVDRSFGGTVNNRTWSGTGATFSSVNDSVTNVTFSTSGTKTIRLTVSNNSGSTYYEQTVSVLPEATLAYPFSDNFEDPNTLIHWNLDGFQRVNIPTTNALRVGSTSSNRSYTLDLQGINLSNLNNPKLKFKYAYQKKSDTEMDESLKVQISNDCGVTWLNRLTKTGSALVTKTPNSTTAFIPTPSDWDEATIIIPTGASWSNNRANVRVRFIYTKNSSSNNFYIDDINLEGSVFVGVDEEHPLSYTIFPNPSSSDVHLKFNEDFSGDLILYNILGQEVFHYKADKQNQITLNLSHLNSAFYWLKLNSKKGTSVEKISIQH